MRLVPKSLFGRLMLILVAGLILAQIVSALILLRDRDENLRWGLGLNLVQRITAIVILIEETSPESRQRIMDAFDTPSFQVFITGERVAPDAGSMPAERLDRLLHEQLPDHDQIQITFTPVFHRPMHHHPEAQPGSFPFRPWRRGAGPPLGFQAGIQLLDGSWLNIQSPLPSDIRSWPGQVLAYLAVLIISITLISLLTVRIITRPLDRLSRAAERLGRDIQSPPLPENGPSEVRRAAAAFNTMQRRLRRFIEDRGEILAAVSHDLKTPLTRLRLRTEMLEDSELKGRMEKDLDEMEQMVSTSLDFMRGTESSEAEVSIDIMALLESLQDDMRELGSDVEIETAESIAPLPGRPLALKRCLGNLLDNAVRYGTRATVRLTQTREKLTIIIVDEGPGVPEAELEALFRPFYRREGSRNRATGGTGLGLGIARNIARGHGGDVTLRSGAQKGLEAVLTLPRPNRR